MIFCGWLLQFCRSVTKSKFSTIKRISSRAKILDDFKKYWAHLKGMQTKRKADKHGCNNSKSYNFQEYMYTFSDEYFCTHKSWISHWKGMRGNIKWNISCISKSMLVFFFAYFRTHRRAISDIFIFSKHWQHPEGALETPFWTDVCISVCPSVQCLL